MLDNNWEIEHNKVAKTKKKNKQEAEKKCDEKTF